MLFSNWNIKDIHQTKIRYLDEENQVDVNQIQDAKIKVNPDTELTSGPRDRILWYENEFYRQKAIEEIGIHNVITKFQTIAAFTVRNFTPDRIPREGLRQVIDDSEIYHNDVEKQPYDLTEDTPNGLTLERTARMLGIDRIRRDFNLTGAGTTIAIIDTGVRVDLDAFKDSSSSQSRVQHSIVEGLNEDTVSSFHGTHVAAIAASNGIYNVDGDFKLSSSTGMAPGANILSIQVLNAAGFGRISWVMLGIEEAAAAGADVITLSLSSQLYNGTGDMQEVIINNAIAGGSVVVAAAGNLGPFGSGIGLPGGFPNVISVGATHFEEDIGRHLMWVSSGVGPRVGGYPGPDVVAPGSDIYSVGITDGAPYLSSGTSMATPHIAGGLLLLREAYPTSTYDQLRTAILAGAEDIFQPVEAMGRGFANFTTAHRILGELTNPATSADSLEMSSAPRRIDRFNYVFRNRLIGQTKTFPLFMHSARNITVIPAVDYITDGVNIELPSSVVVGIGITEFSADFTITATNMQRVIAVIYFRDSLTGNLLPNANITFGDDVLISRSRILFDSSKDFDVSTSIFDPGVPTLDGSTTYFGAHSATGQFALFTRFLEDEGHFIFDHSEGILDTDLLSQYDLLIIANPDAEYSDAEILDIRAFLEQDGKSLFLIAGGGLVSAESIHYSDVNEHTVNAILAGSGLSVIENQNNGADGAITLCEDEDGQSKDDIFLRATDCWNTAQTLRNQELFEPLVEFPSYGPEIRVDKSINQNAESIAHQESKTVIARSEVGESSRILVFSSPLMFDSFGFSFGYGTLDDVDLHRQMSTEAIDWLLEPRAMKVAYRIDGKSVDKQINVNFNETLRITFTTQKPDGTKLTYSSDHLNVTLRQTLYNRSIDRFIEIAPFPVKFLALSESEFVYEFKFPKFGDYEFFIEIVDPDGEFIQSNGYLKITADLTHFDSQGNLRSLGFYLFFAFFVSWVIFLYNEGGRELFLKREMEEKV